MTDAVCDSSGWDAETFRRRLSSERKRHEACSPNVDESTAYAEALAGLDGTGSAVVLGMTPEVRQVAATHFAHVHCLDRSPDAIALFQDWLSPALAEKETVSCLDWFSGLKKFDVATVVFADGCLPNLPPEAQDELLSTIRKHLVRGGRFITRQPCYPESYFTGEDAVGALLCRRRNGWRDDPAFGLAMRLRGFLATCYERDSGRLDNAAVYCNIDAMAADGSLSADEYRCTEFARFSGSNWIFTRSEWEQRLERAGFKFRRTELTRRDWYEYYPVYSCEPSDG